MSEIPETKICAICKVEKNQSEFQRRGKNKDKLHSYCTPCRQQKDKNYWQKNKEEMSLKAKEYREKNKEELKKKSKEHREKNKEEILKRALEYHHKNRDKILEKNKERRLNNLEEHRQRDVQYRLDNLEKIRKREKERRDQKRIQRLLNLGMTLEEIKKKDEEKLIYDEKKERRRRNRAKWMKNKVDSDIQVKIDLRHSKAIYGALLEKGASKGRHSWKDIVGYSLEELVVRLESQFDSNMTWDNYGIYWQIDHIIPKNWYTYESKEDPEFIKCWSLKNLQPLSKTDNASKRNRYAGTPQAPILPRDLYDDSKITNEDLRRLRPDQARKGLLSKQERSVRSPVLLQGVCSDSSEGVP